MARTITECYNYLVSALTTSFATAGITIVPANWSHRNVLRNICYAIAVAQALFEQLADASIAEMTAIQAISASATKKWIQHKMFLFQYSATTPQILQIVNNVPVYPVVDENLQIIKGCSVTTNIIGQVLVKVAKGDPLTALAVGEVSSAQDYIDNIGTAGINYSVVSLDSDKLYLEAEIFFKGAYSAIIEQAVYDALNAYMKNLAVNDFDGYVYALDVERVLRAVEGVNDVVIERLSCRYDTQTIFNGIDLILAKQLVVRRYTTGAGYITEEDTATYTFADKLTFTAE